MRGKMNKILILLCIAAASSISCMFMTPNESSGHSKLAVLPILAEKSAAERRGFAFVQKNIQDENQVLIYSVNSKEAAEFCVSESMGQLMEYAALCGDKAYFAQIAAATEKYFYAPQGYYYWKLNLPAYKPERTSALVDDLRIFRAYYLADAYGLGDYKKKLHQLSSSLYRTGVKNGDPCDYYDGQSRQKAGDVSLFYLDVQTLNLLVKLDSEKWRIPYAHARDILLNIPKNRNGFYPSKFQLAEQNYIWGASVNMVENLYTAIDLHFAGGDVKPLLRFLKKKMDQEGHIFNWYDLDGNAADPNESTAVYALAARLFALSQDLDAAQWCYRKVMDFQIEAGHSFAGGFGDEDSGMVYTFDQMEALLMLRVVKHADE